MIEQQRNDTPLRLRLRVAAKLMILAGLLVSVLVLLSTFSTQQATVPELSSLTVEVGDMKPGTARTINREGRPVIIVRRDIAGTDMLPVADNRRTSEEDVPDGVVTPLAEWFVAQALGTDFSCVVQWFGAADTQQPLPTLLADNGLSAEQWRGGFKDSCRGSWYDANGNVLDGQYATENLTTFPFSIQVDESVQQSAAAKGIQLFLE